jgi:histidyl-tRNA synthetase
MVAEKNGFEFGKTDHIKVYFITIDEKAKEISLKLMHELRNLNISCDTDHLGRSLKAQMRDANKLNAENVYIIGPEEIEKGIGILKNMKDSSQIEIKFDDLINHFRN